MRLPGRSKVVGGALALLLLLALGPLTARGLAASGCPGDPALRVSGRGDLQVFAIQFKEEVDQVASYGSIDAYVDCYFRSYIAPFRDAHVPGLVVFNELTALSFGLEGSLGGPARGFADTPAGAEAGQASGEPLGALGGAIGLISATHSRQLAYYAARFPAAPASLARPFIALTDTYVRAIEGSFAAEARRYHVTVVVGAPLPTLDGTAACAAAGFPSWPACPGWASSSAPADLAALGDPDLADETSVYVAQTPDLENDALVFGPDGRLIDLQPKVNLTPIEQELGWTPAPISTVHAIRIPGDKKVRAGIAISLDAFEHTPSPSPCAQSGDYVGCLASEGVNLLLQPEFNDGTAQCASWSTFSAACGTPTWQPLSWMLSSWYDVRRFSSFRYAVNPFMVGNLYDLTGDGQSAIFARNDPRAQNGSYVGDDEASSIYPDSTDLASLEGPKPGFLAVLPWVDTSRVRDDPALAAGDPSSLETCENGLVAGSGVSTGSCAENAYRVGAIVAELRFERGPSHRRRGRGACRRFPDRRPGTPAGSA